MGGLNEKLFRAIDSAYVIADLARLDGIRGQQKARIEGLTASTDRALSAGARALAIQNQEALSATFQRLGYDQIALLWTRRALDSIKVLLQNETEQLIAAEFLLELQEKTSKA